MTPRQKEVFDFIQSYISNRGFAPTYKEIMQATDIGYKSQCFGLLKNLEQQGKITIGKAKARGISICKGAVREKEQIKRLKKQLEIAKESISSALNFLACPDRISETECNEQLAFEELRKTFEELNK